MKMWWLVALGLLLGSAAELAAQGSRIDLKDQNGKTIAHAVLCSNCKSEGGSEPCHEGTVDGWLDGKPCGSCLLKSNWGVMIRHSRDLTISGRLKLADGTPAKKHYAKMFLPNGWGARTQADDQGHFRIRMGATAERDKGDPIVLDLGERIDVKHEGKSEFSVYLLPEAFAPCADGAAKP